MTLCTVDGCGKRAGYADGLCDGHHKRRIRGQEVFTPLREPGAHLTPAFAWERLLEASLRIAEAEGDEDFNVAAEHLKRAAERYRRAHKKPNRKREATC